MQNQLVANEKIPYAGREILPGQMFHVEHPDHALIFKGTGQARDLTDAEAKSEKQKAAAALRRLGEQSQVKTAEPATGASTDPVVIDDDKKAEDGDKAAKDLKPDAPGLYKTRDMAVETVGSKVSKAG